MHWPRFLGHPVLVERFCNAQLLSARLLRTTHRPSRINSTRVVWLYSNVKGSSWEQIVCRMNSTINFDGALMMNETFVFTEPTKPIVELLLQHLIPIIYSVVAVLSLIGNLAVIVVIVADRQMRRSVNTIIASLAAVDLLFAITSLPSSAVSRATETWPFGNAWCKVSYLQISTASICAFKLLKLSKQILRLWNCSSFGRLYCRPQLYTVFSKKEIKIFCVIASIKLRR